MSWQQLELEDDPRAAIGRAVSVLEAGGLAVFPTDTVYGLLAAAASATAYRRVFELKQRPADKPLALLARPRHPLAALALELLDAFPTEQRMFRRGALTLIIEDQLVPAAVLPAAVRQIQPGRVGLRLPAHTAVQALLKALGGLAWATSANASQAPPPATAAQLLAWLDTLDRPPDVVVTSATPLAGRPSELVLLQDNRLLPLAR